MKTIAATHPENRYVPLKTFCERAGIKIRTGRYWVSIGRVRILPKLKPKDHVYVDWYSWVEDK
ncbi:hypothetical protein ACCW94_21370 [Enterobacter soli]|uniref:hypothetical protein n=1 Tax=Enterobacter soli TaxID=885040 RepID=UPI003ED92578